jgi:hypothetical protein
MGMKRTAMDTGNAPSRATAPMSAALVCLAITIGACHPQPVKTPRAAGLAPAADTSRSSFITEHAQTGFPLLGRHAHMPCEGCHGGRRPTPVCSSCHTSPHDPKLGRKCEDCHTPGLPFPSVKFKHPAKGFFALHQDIPCITCHESKKFLNADRNCTSCHEDYHQGALGRDCYECHRSASWNDTRFNHNMTGFPLMGAHRALECGDCHRDLQSFRIVPRPAGCVSCHEKDYLSSAFPHAAYGAGSNCQECHMQDSWSYAHSPAWFNIQTGRHAGIACSSCHKNGGNYREYTCHDCHAGHEDDNNGRCLDCHPGGFPKGGRGD